MRVSHDSLVVDNVEPLQFKCQFDNVRSEYAAQHAASTRKLHTESKSMLSTLKAALAVTEYDLLVQQWTARGTVQDTTDARHSPAPDAHCAVPPIDDEQKWRREVASLLRQLAAATAMQPAPLPVANVCATGAAQQDAAQTSLKTPLDCYVEQVRKWIDHPTQSAPPPKCAMRKASAQSNVQPESAVSVPIVPAAADLTANESRKYTAKGRDQTSKFTGTPIFAFPWSFLGGN